MVIYFSKYLLKMPEQELVKHRNTLFLLAKELFRLNGSVSLEQEMVIQACLNR